MRSSQSRAVTLNVRKAQVIFFEYALYSPTSNMVHYVQVRTTRRAALHECARRLEWIDRAHASATRAHERAQALARRGPAVVSPTVHARAAASTMLPPPARRPAVRPSTVLEHPVVESADYPCWTVPRAPMDYD
jgi:hypothetical protein